MTLDEAITIYENNAKYERTHGNLQGYLDFKQLAEWLKELKQLREQQPCEDCISREEALKAIDKSKYSDSFCEEHHIDWSINLGMAHIVINELPSVTPARARGKWIPVSERLPEIGIDVLICDMEGAIYLSHRLSTMNP